MTPSTLILRHCHLTRLNYIARTVPPLAFWLSEVSRQYNALQFLFHHWSECWWWQKLESMLSASQTWRVRPLAVAGHFTSSILGIICEDISGAARSFSRHNFLHSLLLRALPAVLLFLSNCKHNALQQSSVYTKVASSFEFRNSSQSVLDSAKTAQCSARLKSAKVKEVGSWILAIPSSNELALQLCEFRRAACLRLGLPLPVEKVTN